MNEEMKNTPVTPDKAFEAPDQPVTQAQTPPPVQPETTEGGIFGITTETKASNNVPIPPIKKVDHNSIYPTGYAFPIARLVNVVSNPTLEKKDGSTTAVLQFIFRDKDGRQHTHTEWEVDLVTDADAKKKAAGMNVRVKHLYTVVFNNFPETGIGNGAKSYGEYFNIIAEAFNSRVDEDGKKLYAKNEYFLKLVYYKTNLGFPLSPNFIEKINPASPSCKQLTVNPRYDKIKPEESNSTVPGAIPGAGEMPDFEKDFE